VRSARCASPWEEQTKATTAAQLTFHLDLRAVSRADRFRYGKTKSCPTILTRARLIDAEKALEDVRQRGGRYADTRIVHLENTMEVVSGSPHFHDSTARSKPNRIIE
jgi:hypothetical protein